MKQNILPAIRLTIITIIFFCVAYTTFIWVIAQASPSNGNGETITVNGKVVGYALEGQSFTQDKYFWSRPSATSPQPYNAGASSGSNQGPRNPALADAVRDRIKALRDADPGNTMPVPVDLVTASGSGLDPNISVAAALYQVSRVAKARGMSEDKVRALVDQSTLGRTFGILGEPRVNVLELNLALNRSSG